MGSDREYFNARAGEWDEICIHDSDKVNHIVQTLNIAPSDCILDVGSGTGVLIPYLLDGLKGTGKIVAVDVSENMLAIAESKYKSPLVEWRHGDVLELHWERGFDVIVCYSMFPHFKERKMEAIERLVKLLNNGGRLCIAHSQSRDAINALHLKAGENVKNDRLPEMLVLQESFAKQGLKETCVMDNEEYFVIVGVKG